MWLSNHDDNSSNSVNCGGERLVVGAVTKVRLRTAKLPVRLLRNK